MNDEVMAMETEARQHELFGRLKSGVTNKTPHAAREWVTTACFFIKLIQSPPQAGMHM